MLTVDYSVRNFDLAWDAIDRGEPLDVVVRGWRVPILRRSMPLCEAFFGRERRSVELMFAWRRSGATRPCFVQPGGETAALNGWPWR